MPGCSIIKKLGLGAWEALSSNPSTAKTTTNNKKKPLHFCFHFLIDENKIMGYIPPSVVVKMKYMYTYLENTSLQTLATKVITIMI
jgi:hypothetical protein